MFDDRDVQLFVGPNGSGKTNLIEAISILSLTKSCRGRGDQDMVQWEQSYYRIRGDVRSDAGETHRMEAVTQLSPRKQKAFFINDVRTQPVAMIGRLPTVTFLPQDLLLFSGPPAERRRFIDQLLSQVSPDYFHDLLSYQKIIQQRNALLKRIAKGQEQPGALDVWDNEVASKGARITLARLELIETFNLSFLQEMGSLGETWQDVRLRYERVTVSRTQAEAESELREALLQARVRDTVLQSTTVGPHREDWQAFQHERAIPTFASRGQERVAVLALLLLEVSYLELRRGEKPLILLDDAFSELDDNHQAALLEACTGYQVIMTTTRIPPSTREDAAIHQVRNGSVEVVTSGNK